MDFNEAAGKLKDLERENGELKTMLADALLKNGVLTTCLYSLRLWDRRAVEVLVWTSRINEDGRMISWSLRFGMETALPDDSTGRDPVVARRQ